VANRLSHLSPVGSLFAAFLGYNPMQVLLGHAELAKLAPSAASTLTSRAYFPHLIAPAFSRGLNDAFAFAAVVCLLGAVASLLRGGKFHYQDDEPVVPAVDGEARVSAQEAIAETESLVVE
jgi:hypothetical protein